MASNGNREHDDSSLSSGQGAESRDSSDVEGEAPAGPLIGGPTGGCSALSAAFSRVLGKKTRRKEGILGESKTNQKRKREDEDELEAVAEQVQKRKGIYEMGHVKVPKLGMDPEHDAENRRLVKLATKGVVRLFNTVAKLQHAQKKASSKAATRAAERRVKFLDELKKPLDAGRQEGEGMGNNGKRRSATGEQNQEGHSGWDVLSGSIPSPVRDLNEWDSDAEEEEEESRKSDSDEAEEAFLKDEEASSGDDSHDEKDVDAPSTEGDSDGGGEW
ncbi:unnamed protein product [Ostreobium quekettii]|uniref:RRP15-like protein n=1 Tax=Ostreobium quekettii TaxID=121088 RepID=A0A8S1IWF6_9CHLO|nr:unnamed protein product [Ostreobium quekettii]